MESSSSSSSSDSSSDSSSSDEDNENVEEDNNARKVKVDVDTTSQRVPSAKQLNSVGKITEPVLTKILQKTCKKLKIVNSQLCKE